MIRSFVLLFYTIVFINVALGQNADSTIIKDKKFVKYLQFRLENGIILNNGIEESSELIKNSYYNGVDFRLGFRLTDPDDIYSNVYRRPILGVGFYASTFNNMNIGKPSAVYFFITVPMAFERNRKLTFSYSGAFGLSYNFTPYDSITNPSNLFIGSEHNCYFHFGLSMNYKLGSRFELSMITGLKHFSNGSFKKPNKGLNLIPFTLGVRYKLNKEEIIQEKRPIPDYIPHDNWSFSAAVGSKHYDIDDPGNYLKMTYMVRYLRQINYMYRIGGGFDFFYSAGVKDRVSPEEDLAGKAFSCAVVGTFEWAINENLYVPIGFGVYLKRNEVNEELIPYYERVGIRYKFNNNIFAGVTIKAHNGKADFFEWTIGYTLQNDKNRY